ncbi:MAG: AraC family transcriptional regulator [Dysgonamonadaceae bacterium]|jgi:AraC-like DNA-binding protein|nr:AraC family transcriptional regulator [Dysgonamonadaceae bacterium]
MKFETLFFAKGLLCLFICIIHTTVIYGQNSDFQHQKDSLLKVIASTQGEEKLEAYRILIRLRFPEEEIRLRYINDFIREAREQQNKKYESVAYRYELVYLWNNLKKDEFKQKANKYMPFIKKYGSSEHYYSTYATLIGFGNNKERIEKVKQMYAEAKREECLYGIVRATLLMATLYSMEKRYEEEEEYSRETIKNALKLIKEESGQVEYYHIVSKAYVDLYFALINQHKQDECFALMPVWKKHTANFEETFGYSDPNLLQYYRIYALIYIDKEEFAKAELYCDSMKPMVPPLSLSYIYNINASICEGRKEWNSALDWVDKEIDHCTNRGGELDYVAYLLMKKSRILSKIEHAEKTCSTFEKAIQLNDSLRLLENNAQLDEIRTQYEVDKHITEKEHLRSNLFFALGGCVLLAILLGVWIYYSRKITHKNRTLAQQIKESTAQHEEQIKEMLAKTSFLPYSLNETTSVADNDLCVESRMDKLCAAIRDLLFKDKIYRDSSLTQELMVEKVGTNIKLFSEAFEYCFKMQFKDYINFLRLKDAVYLLEQSDLSIEEISNKAGFGTVRTFRRQFIAKYNITPKDYRNSIKTPDIPIQ